MKMRSIRCALDGDGCIDLLAVLKVMNQINQEQAWAIAYELARLMQRKGATNCAPIDNLAQVQLHSDGYVHEKSVQVAQQGSVAVQATTTMEKCHAKQQQQQQQQQRNKQQVSIKRNSQDIEMDEKVVCSELDHTTIEQITHSKTSSTQPITSPDQCDRLSATNSGPGCTNDDSTQLATATTTTTINVTTTKNNTINNNNNNNNNTTTTTSKVPPTPPITPEMLENASSYTSDDTAPVSISGRRPAANETELVASLGIALFWALDYGIPDDEERKLSISMEYLIYQSQTKLSLSELVEICTRRLSTATEAQADLHYRSICKSLVYDTIELSLFLDKIYTATMVLSDFRNQQKATISNGNAANLCNFDATGDHIIVVDDDIIELGEPLASLRALRINDWARLWMQVIRELRQRGKFKQQAIAAVG